MDERPAIRLVKAGFKANGREVYETADGTVRITYAQYRSGHKGERRTAGEWTATHLSLYDANAPTWTTLDGVVKHPLLVVAKASTLTTLKKRLAKAISSE